MNAPAGTFLPDVQAFPDERSLPIQRVGIRGLRYPLRLRGMDGEVRHTVADVDMAVALPHDVKGTHMSRFVEVLEAERDAVDFEGLGEMLMEMLERLAAQEGRVSMSFPYFVRKRAPVSGVESLVDVRATFTFEKRVGEPTSATLCVATPVTSLCPCSREISEYGAHNQRSLVTITAALLAPVAIEELVRIAESEASCEVFGLLKRADEKWVTERAYDNPKFVEDLVRDVALRLRDDARIAGWRVESENFESIHNHSAYALIHGEHPRSL